MVAFYEEIPVHGKQTASQFVTIHVPSQGVTPGLEQSSVLHSADCPSPPGQHELRPGNGLQFVFDVKH